MRVVEEGPQEFYYSFKCRECGSTLQATAEDVQASIGDEYGPSYFVQCGMCGAIHHLREDRIPYLVKLQACRRRNKK